MKTLLRGIFRMILTLIAFPFIGVMGVIDMMLVIGGKSAKNAYSFKVLNFVINF